VQLLGERILEMQVEAACQAGTFRLLWAASAAVGPLGRPRGDNVALMLRTSGTTSTPKMVPQVISPSTPSLLEEPILWSWR
jgi:hypothetical protein